MGSIFGIFAIWAKSERTKLKKNQEQRWRRLSVNLLSTMERMPARLPEKMGANAGDAGPESLVTNRRCALAEGNV